MILRIAAAALLLVVGSMRAQQPEPACSMCKVWNQPQTPFRIYGNTYYVGTHGLTSVLIVSDQGDVLIDGALRESAPLIAANIKALGFRLEDVKLIVNSHVHMDHAGGIAELQRLTGARVLASPWSAAVLKAGGVDKADPQYGDIRGIDPVAKVGTLTFEQPILVGPLSLTPHSTPGHTPGGTSWTWQSCEAGRCLNMVYADSITAVSAPGFLFTKTTAYPNVLADFEKNFKFFETVPCDILMTAHPEAADLLVHAEARDKGATPNPLVDNTACKRLAESGRKSLAERIAKEKGQ
jgi:metallo-beta-lactamase class B